MRDRTLSYHASRITHHASRMHHEPRSEETLTAMAFTDQRGRTQTSLSEINVTPLVDVMLVLLVIFMVTAPILQTGIEVNLPKTQETRAEQPKPKAVVVSIDKDGNIYLSTQAE